MRNTVCIYCKGNGPFNTEHVIQEAFGLFGTETLTLLETVCEECNKAFGANIDRIATRETIEAFERLKTGTKPLEEAHELVHKNIQMRLQAGPLKGARFTAYPDNTISSLGLRRRDTGEFQYFTLKELKALEHIDREVYSAAPKLQNILVLKDPGVTCPWKSRPI